MNSLARYRLLLTTLLFLLLAACAQQPVPYTAPADRPVAARETPWPAGRLLALSYHDIEDVDPDNVFLSVGTANLFEQLAWLRENGYQAVSVDQVLEASRGGKPLPEKAVLLTFDDGFASFRERVLPVLKAYQWPAVLAPVGVWLETPANWAVSYGGVPVPRSRFADAAQLREIVDSGLVELGAHSDNLHFGARANPQGNLQPAAASRLHDERTGQYESEEAYRQRIATDVARINRKIKAITGTEPRVWVWPYGDASGTALEIVAENGHKVALTLVSGLASVDDLRNAPRLLIGENPDTPSFANAVTRVEEINAMRVAHVDLDYVYDPDPVQMEKNLGLLVQRIADMRINTVFLQAYADPTGDGTVNELYFPNRHLPMRADLFNRTAWQLRTRAEVDVYAWMPVLSFALDPSLPRVASLDPETGLIVVDPDQYRRLSPFDPRARQQIAEIYEDLAGHASFHGLLFHDDAILSDFEDASQAALNAYAAAGMPADIGQLHSDPEQMQRWTRFKSRFLVDFTLELAERVKAIRGPQIRTARNLFARPVINPRSEAWFAQNLQDFLASYDWTAIMAMPLMEGVSLEQSDRWLAALVQQVAAHPGALERTVFELQARDWRAGQQAPIDSDVLVRWMRQLQWNGARHFGYYPDDFHTDNPSLDKIRPVFSNAWSTQR